jgi:hypothetical protein
MNRLVRTRMLGGVGAGGEKPPATRFGKPNSQSKCDSFCIKEMIWNSSYFSKRPSEGK